MSDLTSFRDPAGYVVVEQERLLRYVNSAGLANLRAYLESPAVRDLTAAGSVVSSTVLDSSPATGGAATVVEHERLWFPSYAHEWAPEMLHAAGMLTIDLASSLLAEGRGLKDATPHNVLFRGSQPVFVDVLSFEPRKPRDPVWLAAAQFSRTFVLPLVANRLLGLPLDQIFTSRRDGLTPLELRKWTRGIRAYFPPLLSAVTLPALLSSLERPGLYVPREARSSGEAQFVLSMHFRRLRKQLGPPPHAAHSGWSRYQEERPSYTGSEHEAKRNFVRRALERARPRRVLDAGANTGEFALLAAEARSEAGATEVVAIDIDPTAVGRLWRRAQESNANILALVIDLARPSPPLGWRNGEQSSFLDRGRGKFDCILMLALVHHLLVTERVPLREVFRLAAELSTGSLIIEYVGPGDPMFQKIARGRDGLHADLSPEMFEREAAQWFHTADSLQAPGSHRKLYWMERR